MLEKRARKLIVALPPFGTERALAVRIHSRADCEAPCVFHSPSKHYMRNWTKKIRFDRAGLVERICEHGCGHPDPDSLQYIKKLTGEDQSIHGCDGCCHV